MYGLSYIYQDKLTTKHPLNTKNILSGYIGAIKNPKLLVFTLVLTIASNFSYCYTTAGPFIVYKYLDLNSAEYGSYNIFTIFGIIIGSTISAKIINKYSNIKILKIAIASLLIILGLLAILTITKSLSTWIFFILITLMYFTTSIIYPASSHIASNSSDDKANASTMMNFLNMTGVVIAISLMGYIPYPYP